MPPRTSPRSPRPTPGRRPKPTPAPSPPTSPSSAPPRPGEADHPTRVPLPADDAALLEMTLAELRQHWAPSAAAPAMSAEAMTGADRRAQLLGITGIDLMEQAGAAVAAAVRALAVATERWGHGPILILCGPGNNGGDGFVAARRLARMGASVIVAFVAAEARPKTADAAADWDRLADEPRVTRVHAPVARDVSFLAQHVAKAAVVVDALLGTGVRGVLRDPIRAAVELTQRAREAAIPIVAVDTPTAVDLTSGEASDPVVRADLTVTFHRPKLGLLTRRGAALAGRVLVAPIGIPPDADRA